MSKKIIAVIGARPQFIKHAPIDYKAKSYNDLDLITIHTGQHYDANMSAIFFDQLNISKPNYMLEIGSYSHGKQTGRMMEQIEEIVLEEKPDGILVYGDTNSTLAGALVGAKLNIPIFHVEAGLRSFNKSMPEEQNRILTDNLSSLLFVPTENAIKNLDKENIKSGVIQTGDIMYDMILIAQQSGMLIEKKEEAYYLATIHRPYNTDDIGRLSYILRILDNLKLPVKFPLHPRTRNLLKKNMISLRDFVNIKFMEPVSYFENINLMFNSSAIITDSGGMQKEAYFLKTKCITVRPETEWTETLFNGWNTLLFDKLEKLPELIEQELGPYKENLYGKGDSSDVILREMYRFLVRTDN